MACEYDLGSRGYCRIAFDSMTARLVFAHGYLAFHFCMPVEGLLSERDIYGGRSWQWMRSFVFGHFFVQGFPGQTIQVRVRYRGKKALSIKLVVQDIHNGNQGGRDQNTQHTEGGHA